MQRILSTRNVTGPQGPVILAFSHSPVVDWDTSDESGMIHLGYDASEKTIAIEVAVIAPDTMRALARICERLEFDISPMLGALPSTVFSVAA